MHAKHQDVRNTFIPTCVLHPASPFIPTIISQAHLQRLDVSPQVPFSGVSVLPRGEASAVAHPERANQRAMGEKTNPIAACGNDGESGDGRNPFIPNDSCVIGWLSPMDCDVCKSLGMFISYLRIDDLLPSPSIYWIMMKLMAASMWAVKGPRGLFPQVPGPWQWEV